MSLVRFFWKIAYDENSKRGIAVVGKKTFTGQELTTDQGQNYTELNCEKNQTIFNSDKIFILTKYRFSVYFRNLFLLNRIPVVPPHLRIPEENYCPPLEVLRRMKIQQMVKS